MESIRISEAKFYQFMQSKLKVVYLYENRNLLKHAADLIPSEELSMKATLKLSVVDEKDQTISFEDLLLLELLNWFKFSFFQWVDVPKCDVCGGIPNKIAPVSPNEQEIRWGASTVEHYYCTACDFYIRFPRYNHPKKLLETRCGRCGEWANCFTLLCRALKFDTRLVCDFNDHVWTEVFSFSQNRWLHCDPCENICDKPLLYELGWKKPMSYVIAFSSDEIQDVTWRYTSNFRETMSRRNLCREKWLLSCLWKFSNKLQEKVSYERRSEIELRAAIELADFLTEPSVNTENLGGRTSGSLSWRMARGETDTCPPHISYVFKLNDKEIEQRYLHIKYSCSTDRYIRVSDQSSENESWSSCLYSKSNVFRKVELDWKVVYLSRIEGSSKGRISWRFDFIDSGLAVKKLTLRTTNATFENGKVKWFIFSNLQTDNAKIFNADEVFLETYDFKGSVSIEICAELSEGKGQTAWQHSQLFRQAIDSVEFPFEVQIALYKA